MNAGSVLEVRGVTVRFGGLTALNAVSLAVPPQHVLGVIGPNGAGKTTLLNVLCGFIRPDAGEVLFGSGRAESELAELGGLIRDLATEGSLVVVEHHMDLMMAVCDSIVVLDFGKVIATGTPREVQDHPAVTAAYLGTLDDPAPSGPAGQAPADE